MKSKDYVNISEVSQQTGVAAVTLRAWERRYGLIKPKKTAKGHRLYSQADIDKIKQIISWLSRGVAISKAAELLTATEQPLHIDENDESWLQIQKELLNTLIELKLRSLNPLVDKLNKSMPFVTLCEKVYQPLSDKLRTRWQKQPLGHQLEKQLWQQCWQRQITVMTLRADKQKPKASVWLVNLDENDISLDYWLFYALLLQDGIQINAINQLDNLNTLPRLKKSIDQPLIVFGTNKISTPDFNQLTKAKTLWNEDIFAAGTIAKIHHDKFADIDMNCIDDNTSGSWLFRQQNSDI